MATKKPPSKKSSSSQKEKSEDKKKTETIKTPTPQKNYNIWYILGGVLLVVLVIGFLFKDRFVVATVNGKPVLRAEYVKQLEIQNGQAVLDNLILEKLILEEAKNQGVVVTQEQIDVEVDTLSQSMASQGQTIESVLAMQGMTLSDLHHQIRLKTLVQMLSQSNVEVTDEEVANYMAENEELVAQYEGEEDIESLIKEQLASQKSQESTSAWIENLQTQAVINYW